MKTIQSFLIVALIAVVAVGCGKVEKILPKKDGTWKTTKQEARYYINDVLRSTDSDITATSWTFKDDGTGSYVENGGTQTFTWEVNDDNEVIQICLPDGSLSFCFDFNIIESKSDSQSWLSITTDDTIRQEQEFGLERE